MWLGVARCRMALGGAQHGCDVEWVRNILEHDVELASTLAENLMKPAHPLRPCKGCECIDDCLPVADIGIVQQDASARGGRASNSPTPRRGYPHSGRVSSAAR